MPKAKEQPVIDTNAYLNEKIFTNLLRALVRGYQYYNQNKLPTKIVVRCEDNVNGIPVIFQTHGVDDAKA